MKPINIFAIGSGKGNVVVMTDCTANVGDPIPNACRIIDVLLVKLAPTRQLGGVLSIATIVGDVPA